MVSNIIVRVIRILFLITEFNRGGAERALYDLISRVDRSRFAPQVACLDGPGYYSEKYRALGIPVHHLGLSTGRAATLPFSLARTVLKLSGLLRRERIEVLQSFLFHANIIGRIAARLVRTPVVLGAVRTAEPRYCHTLLDGLTFFLTDGEVCVSEATRRFQARRAFLPLGKLFVLPNGVDRADFPLPSAPFGCGAQASLDRRLQIRKDMNLPSEEPVFAFVGRLCVAKAVPDLLTAFSDVVRRRPEAHLVIAGAGPLAAPIRNRVRRLGLEQRVMLPGWLDDPRPLYSAADCFVLSSTVEGMPGALLEAMASGLPVVCTDAAGCTELVADGDTGFVVRRGDVSALAARMLAVLQNPGGAAEMGQRGRCRALEGFNLEGIVRKYEALYEELLRKAKAR
jgi:glycosyltransferase involved in cell wall biosynthesis